MTWIVFLDVNGLAHFKECKSMADAERTGKRWARKATKAYPNKEWRPVIYEAKKKKELEV